MLIKPIAPFNYLHNSNYILFINPLRSIGVQTELFFVDKARNNGTII
jgi:hypothetical protein